MWGLIGLIVADMYMTHSLKRNQRMKRQLQVVGIIIVFFILLMGLAASKAHAITIDPYSGDLVGESIWCDAYSGLYGYVLTFHPDDNIIATYVRDPVALYALGFQNGGFTTALALMQHTTGQTHWGYSWGSGIQALPYQSLWMGPMGDNSLLIVPNYGFQSIPIVTTYTTDNLTAMSSWCGGLASCYHPGYSAVDTLNMLTYQAGQMTQTAGVHWQQNQTPGPPGSTAINTVLANLNQATPQPNALSTYNGNVTPPEQFAMFNYSPARLTVNGGKKIVNVPVNTWLDIEAESHSPGCIGHQVEVWIAGINQNNGRIWWMDNTGTWVRQDIAGVQMAASTTLSNLTFPLFQGQLGPGYTGTWDWFFCLDMRPDGIPSNPIMCSTVRTILY